MTRVKLGATFVDSIRGRILLSWKKPENPRGTVFVFPPFAEEMNKCRSMISSAAMQLAERGLATIVPDLYGTGDSEGRLADADWETWITDASVSLQWAERNVAPITRLLAIRLGACLCTETLKTANLHQISSTVLWQPVYDARKHLTQFLRLRTAASMAKHAELETADTMLQALNAGRVVEVAGYELGQQLAAQMVAIPPTRTLPTSLGAVTWIEVQKNPSSAPGISTKGIYDASVALGMQVQFKSIAGPTFWNSTEQIQIPQLRDETVSALS